MKKTRCMELLGNLVGFVSAGNDTKGTIEELLKYGFEPEELIDDFGFSIKDVGAIVKIKLKKILENDQGYVLEDVFYETLHIYIRSVRDYDGIKDTCWNTETIHYDTGIWSSNDCRGAFSGTNKNYIGRKNAIKAAKRILGI